MDLQRTSVRQRLEVSANAQLTRPRRRPAQANLNCAQPVMGQGEPADNPLDPVDDTYQTLLAADGDIVIRRRASSSEVQDSVDDSGILAMALVRQLAIQIRRENRAGENEAATEMEKLGFDRGLINQLVNRHHGYLRITRALAGGKERATRAQQAQAFALCVFDVNRYVFTRELFAASAPDDSSAASQTLSATEKFAVLVNGAKKLTGFADLHATLDLWMQIGLKPSGDERKVMMNTLINFAGLFHTNAQRFLNAFDDAEKSGPAADIPKILRVCLVKQWMSGPSEEEREALRGASGEQSAEFHRKLIQQYALVCRSFGQPMPPLTELILVDDDD